MVRGVMRSGRRRTRRLRHRLPLGRRRRVRRYWDDRYASNPVYVSSGHIALSNEDNQRDFVVRAEILRETLKRLRLPGRDRLLDAGCGNGLFVKIYHDLGFSTTAFDISGEAIAQARKQIGGPCEWSVAAIESFRSSQPFDFVICFGALMHITTDTAHRRALRNLASLTDRGGHLIIEELFAPAAATQAAPLGRHIRKRTLDDYGYLTGVANLELAEHLHFETPVAGQRKSLLVFRAAV